MMDKGPNIIAVIPARAGSKFIPNQNVRIVGGHPLVYYTIKTAIKSKFINQIIVSTDSEEYADLARKYGADVPFLRTKELASDTASSR